MCCIHLPFLQVREELVDLTMEFKANRHPIGARVSGSFPSLTKCLSHLGAVAIDWFLTFADAFLATCYWNVLFVFHMRKSKEFECAWSFWVMYPSKAC